jgi:LacI family transcriptional regulator
MSPTLKDVADKAGVSTSTVSRVLNDLPGISTPTRVRVLEAARELGYSANMSARGLATARTYNIGVVSYQRPPHLMADMVPGSNTGIEEGLRQSGYHMLTAHVSKGMMRRNEILPMVRERRVDGLILIGPAIDRRYILQLHSTGTPIVLFDNMLEETDLDCVLSDNERGAYEVTRHLLTVRRHRCTVFLSGPTHWHSSRERYAGYVRAVSEAGLEPHRVVMPDTTIETGEEAMRPALEAIPDLTAVVGVNDATAWGAGRACKEAGLTVPDDIAIVGYDDVGWARLHEPPLTTVRMNTQEMGFQAARRLIELIERGPSPPLRIRVGTEVIVRGSCGAREQPAPSASEERR